MEEGEVGPATPFLRLQSQVRLAHHALFDASSQLIETSSEDGDDNTVFTDKSNTDISDYVARSVESDDEFDGSKHVQNQMHEYDKHLREALAALKRVSPRTQSNKEFADENKTPQVSRRGSEPCTGVLSPGELDLHALGDASQFVMKGVGEGRVEVAATEPRKDCRRRTGHGRREQSLVLSQHQRALMR